MVVVNRPPPVNHRNRHNHNQPLSFIFFNERKERQDRQKILRFYLRDLDTKLNLKEVYNKINSPIRNKLKINYININKIFMLVMILNRYKIL